MIYGRLNATNLTLNNPVSVSWISMFNEDRDAHAMIYIDELQDLIKGNVIQFVLRPGNKTAGSNGLESTTIALGDNVLLLDGNGFLPDLTGEKIDIKENNGIKVPGMSYGFLVFTQTNIAVCA